MYNVSPCPNLVGGLSAIGPGLDFIAIIFVSSDWSVSVVGAKITSAAGPLVKKVKVTASFVKLYNSISGPLTQLPFPLPSYLELKVKSAYLGSALAITLTENSFPTLAPSAIFEVLPVNWSFKFSFSFNKAWFLAKSETLCNDSLVAFWIAFCNSVTVLLILLFGFVLKLL